MKSFQKIVPFLLRAPSVYSLATPRVNITPVFLNKTCSVSFVWNFQVQHIHVTNHHFSKGKNIKKDKKKNVMVDENELIEIFESDKILSDFVKPLEYFKSNLIQFTSLRSTRGSIENIQIQFEDNKYKLQDLAEIIQKNPNMYILEFAAFPQAIPEVVKTFRLPHLNINAQQEGTKLFVPVPKVTKEYREALAKKAKSYFVECKDKIREVQIKYVKKLKKIEGMSEETEFRITEQLTALGNKYIKMAEDILKTKQDELLVTGLK